MRIDAAPLVGFCGVTYFGTGCGVNTTSGAWQARDASIHSLADCAVRCLECARCQYISFSAPLSDCSWFERCRTSELRTDTEGGHSFRTVRVRWNRNATASAAAAEHWRTLRTVRPTCPLEPVTTGSSAPLAALDSIGRASGAGKPATVVPLIAAASSASEPLLLLGILSASASRRALHRCTWLQAVPHGEALRVRFVVGLGASDRTQSDVLEAPIQEGETLHRGSGSRVSGSSGGGGPWSRGPGVHARTASGYFKMRWFTAYAALQPYALVGMADDDVYIQPRMLLSYAQLLHAEVHVRGGTTSGATSSSSAAPPAAVYAGVFEWFSWRRTSLVATGWGRSLEEGVCATERGMCMPRARHARMPTRPHAHVPTYLHANAQPPIPTTMHHAHTRVCVGERARTRHGGTHIRTPSHAPACLPGLYEAQLAWRNCSPTGAGWAQTRATHCDAVEARGVHGDCVGPFAFAKGPLDQMPG